VRSFGDELIAAFASDELNDQGADPSELVFSSEARQSVIDRLIADSRGDVTPRRIMQSFGNVLDSALAIGAQFPITLSAATRLYRPPVEGEIA
jgi:hypothetical protein